MKRNVMAHEFFLHVKCIIDALGSCNFDLILLRKHLGIIF